MPDSRSLLPLHEPPAHAAERTTQDQRHKIREFCDYLRSDLYRRDGGGEKSAVWTSPLGWAVEYGVNDDGLTIWARIYSPDGRSYGSSDLATVYWLEAVLP